MSGTNFGLNDSLRYFEIELDSLDNSGTFNSSYAATDWPSFRLLLPLTGVAAMKIIEVQIPFSYYVINGVNNTFILRESVGMIPNTVTLPVGNYDANTLVAALGTALTAASASGTSPNRYTYTVTYAVGTGKITITSSGANVFDLIFGLPTNSGNVNPRLFIGFPGGDTASNSSGVLVSPNAIQITGPDYLYVNSQTIGSDCKTYLPVGAVNIAQGGQGPQMAKVPVNCNPGSTIYWQDPDAQKWFDLDDRNNFPLLDFYLTMGNTNYPIQLNGLSFSIKLGILTNDRDHTADVTDGNPVSGRLSVTTVNPRKRRK